MTSRHARRSLLATGIYGHSLPPQHGAPIPWPQDEETMVGTGEKRKSLLYNGYAEQVASLYP